MYKSLADARRALLARGEELEPCTKYPIRFADGTIIHQQPEKMETRNGLPVMNAEKYLKENHPDLVDKFKQGQAKNNELLKHLDR